MASPSARHAAETPIAFNDLEAQQRRLRDGIEAAIARVLAHGQYIMGPEVRLLEQRLSAFCGARHTISCANGTDALMLALAALGVGRGDAVLVPSFTFAATAEVVPWFGAVPVFVDVRPDTFNIDPASLERGIGTARAGGHRPVGVIAVDLFGQPADYAALEEVAAGHGLWLVADAAQSFGASYRGRRAGRLARITTTSFFPAKPLGCYGDGGAVFTDDDELASLMRSFRVHGQGSDKYDNIRVGLNARLDTLQAAILLEKLQVFEDEIAARQDLAAAYGEALAGRVRVPAVPDGASSVWAQYTVALADRDRDAVARALLERGVPTAVYYRRPLHLQTAYRSFPVASGGNPVAEELAERVLSLPMHGYMDALQRERVMEALEEVL